MSRSDAKVQGTVQPGFEPVRAAFEENFARRGEVGAACAVYLEGEKVVDLWGGQADPKAGKPWREDTLVNVFSTTKGVSSMAIAVAHTRGLFDFDDPVSRHWPEFAAAGKERVTIRQLLSHQAGLAAIDAPIDLATLADLPRLGAILGAQPPLWTPGERHGYHGVTLGFYESELIRRVDPRGRSIGRFFADEVAAPLGLDFHIGLGDGTNVARDRIARILGENYALRMLANIYKLPAAFVFGFMNPRSLTHRAFSNPAALGQPDQYNTEALRTIELPAANGHGTARSIAKAYGVLATGGGALGLGEKTLSALEQPATPPTGGLDDLVLRRPTSFSLGYCKPFPGFEIGSARAFGTPGAGGSLGFADPERRLGFAYVMNRMDFHLISDPREVALSSRALQCADRVRGARSDGRKPAA